MVPLSKFVDYPAYSALFSHILKKCSKPRIFRLLSLVLAFFSKNNRNTLGNPLKTNVWPQMPRKTIDRSGNSDFLITAFKISSVCMETL